MSEIERPPLPDLAPTVSEAELAEIRAAVEPAGGPWSSVRELSTPMRAALAAAASGAVVLTGLFWVQGLRDDLSPGLASVLALIIAAGAAWLPWALSSFARPNPEPGRRVGFAVLGVALVVALAVLPVWPGMNVPPEMRPAVDQRCSLWAAFNGSSILVLFLLFDRHGGRRLFATLSATAAAISMAFAVQTLNCPCIDLAHIAGAHAVSGSLAGLAYTAIRTATGGRRV